MFDEDLPQDRRMCISWAAALVLWSSACLPPRCLPLADTSMQIVRVDHISKGDGPTAWSLAVFSDGSLRLEKLGERPKCKNVLTEVIEDLHTQVSSTAFRNATAHTGFKSHRELLQVHLNEDIRVFLAESPPEGIAPTLATLDEIFSEAFGNTYDWSLTDPGL